MSIESPQSGIGNLDKGPVALNRRNGQMTLQGYEALIGSLEEIAASGLEEADRLRAESERHLRLQYTVARALAESNEISEASLKVLRAICSEMGWEFGAFWIFSPDANNLYVESIWHKPGLHADELVDASRRLSPSPGEDLPGSVYLTNKPLWLSDHADQGNFPRKAAATNCGFNSVVAFPLRKGAEEVLGVMEFFSPHIEAPTADLLDMFNAFASQIGEFMGRKYAEDLRATQMQQQAVIANLSKRALLGIDLQELFNEACAEVARTLFVDFCNVLELLPEKQQVLFRAGSGWNENVIGQYHLDLEPDSQPVYVLSENRPVSILEVNGETRFQAVPILTEHKIVSGMSVVISGRFRPFGLLEAYSTDRCNFTQDDLHFLEGVAHVLAAAIQHQDVEEALRLSRNQLSVILDGIADGITAQNKNGQLIYANDTAASILGYASADELMNTPVERITSMFEIFDESGAKMSMTQLPGRLALQGQPSLPMTIRFKVLKTGEERWSVVKAQPVMNDMGQVMMAVNIFHDITELKRAELAQRLLAEASKVMAKELDYRARLNNLANLLVPTLADWCAIDLLNDRNELQRVAVAHPDPQMVEWAHEIHERFPPDPNSPTGAYKVIRTNQAEYFPVITDEMIEAVEPLERRELIRKLKLSSVIVVPLSARGHSLGTLSLIWAESKHSYTADDVALTEELARRASLELDNARLYAKAQNLNVELEQRVLGRTAQLEKSNLRLSEEVNERKMAEYRFRRLNAELEKRVVERTSEFENANQKLQREISERELVEEALQSSLQKTREMYEISQAMGLVNTPDELLQTLLSSSYLKSAIRASIAVFDRVWQKDDLPPESCTILMAWNKRAEDSLHIGQQMKLVEYGLIKPYSHSKPMVIADIRDDRRVNKIMRQRLVGMGVVGSSLFPLVAGGEWYGMLSLHFDQAIRLDIIDTRHLRGLVDEVAMGIHNFRLLKAEAQARQEAEQANNLKLKFLAMISHELRTPLTSIKGFSTTLLADDVEWKPENQRDFIETISSEADKLSELIEQLLNLSQLEAGAIRITPRRVKWDQILVTSLAQINALSRNHQLVMQEPESGLPDLHVDVTRVSQVLTNLIANSVKYSPQQTKIVMSVEKLSDQFIKVRIIDEGMGIPAEARSHVFEAFQQLDRGSRTQGAGLGLAICRGLIEAHGGRIWVDDHVGRGTTMSFTLPIAN
jgi:PAS domain S-box-containing protein